MTSLSLNVGNFITMRLTPTNYSLWHEQALVLTESQELVGHLTNEEPIPTKNTIPNPNNTTYTETFVPKLTKEFIAWQNSNHLLHKWIIGTHPEEILGLAIGLDTAHALCEVLKNAHT